MLNDQPQRRAGSAETFSPRSSNNVSQAGSC